MPSWLLPVIKAVLPHVGTIVSATRPMFTRKEAATASGDAALLQQQIAELQAAASDNDAHIRDLAAQIRTTVEALEKLAAQADARHRRMLALCLLALLFSAGALAGVLLFATTHVAA